MSMQITAPSDQNAEIRHLTASELDEVNGGFLPLVLFGIWCFTGGVVAGALYHDSIRLWTMGPGPNSAPAATRAEVIGARCCEVDLIKLV